jgi:hypothetical protein
MWLVRPGLGPTFWLVSTRGGRTAFHMLMSDRANVTVISVACVCRRQRKVVSSRPQLRHVYTHLANRECIASYMH